MKRVATFVDGLDEILNGGVPAGSVVLLTGAPGTMKTSLTYSILHGNALQRTKGRYVSLEQGRESLVDHLSGLGMRPSETEGDLSILDLATLRKKLPGSPSQPWMDLFRMYAQGMRTSFPYELLVLDSLDALEILAKFKDVRRELFELIKWLRSLSCTTFLLGELPANAHGPVEAPRTSFAKHKEEYLADGIVHLRMAAQGPFGMERQLRVVKMRGTRHNADYHALVFEDGFKGTR